MELGEAKAQLEKAVSANETIAMFCSCSVRYSGRAESEIGEGDRLVIVKSDNTLLIHQPEGSSPVNYMKAGSSIDFSVENGFLVMRASSTKFKESIMLMVRRIHSISSMRIEDGSSISLVGTEKDMSDMIKGHPELISKDFKPLSREEHTKFGFIDVFGHDSKGNMVLVECKRYVAGIDAVQQLRRYVEKIAELKGLKAERVKGILAAPEIAKNAQEMMQKWGFSYVRVEPPKRLESYKKKQMSISEF